MLQLGGGIPTQHIRRQADGQRETAIAVEPADIAPVRNQSQFSCSAASKSDSTPVSQPVSQPASNPGTQQASQASEQRVNKLTNQCEAMLRNARQADRSRVRSGRVVDGSCQSRTRLRGNWLRANEWSKVFVVPLIIETRQRNECTTTSETVSFRVGSGHPRGNGDDYSATERLADGN